MHHYSLKYLILARDLAGRRMGITANSSVLTYREFCYEEFEKSMLCKSVTQLEDACVYSESIKSGHVKFNFS